MAYYSDYTTVVTYNTSIVRTESAISNAIADMLVSHAVFTLVGYADTGVDSSATNYAEVKWHDLYLRIYNTTTYAYRITFDMYYAGGAALVETSAYITIPSVYNTSATVTMRFYNTKKGFCTYLFSDTSSWVDFVNGFELKRVADNATYYGISHAITTSNKTIVNDGLAYTGYYHSNPGYKDSDGTSIILTPLSIFSATGFTRFFASNAYNAPAMLQTGLIGVDGRYFKIESYLAIELNA